MSKRILLALTSWAGCAFLFLGVTANAQAPDTLWTRAVTDFALVDSMVVLQDIYDVEEASTGDIVAVGLAIYDDPRTGDIDSSGGLVVKLNSNGDLLWQRLLRGGPNYFSGIYAQADDSLFAAGYKHHAEPFSHETPFVSLLNSSGDSIWTSSLPIDTSIRVDNVRILGVGNGEYLISGYCMNYWTGQKRIFLTWINGVADTIRVKYFYPLDQENVMNINVQPFGNGLVLTFDAGSCGPFCAYFLSNTGDSLSALVSPVTPCFHTTGSPLFHPNSFVYVARNGLDAGISKISADGSLEWQVSYDPLRKLSTPFEDGQGGLILACQRDAYDFGIIRLLDTTGQPDWGNFVAPAGADALLQCDLVKLSDGGFLVAGAAEFLTTPSLARFPYFVRFAAPESIKDDQHPAIPNEIELNVFPNPFNAAMEVSFVVPHTATTSLFVYNVAGQEVAELFDGYAAVGSNVVKFNAAELSSGIYFVVLQFDGNRFGRKALLIK